MPDTEQPPAADPRDAELAALRTENAKLKAAQQPAARAGGAFVADYPSPQDAAAAVKSALEAKLDGIAGVTVAPHSWQWPEGAAGRLQGQLVVHVTATATDQPEVQRRLNGVPGAKRASGPPVYDHCVLADTAPAGDDGRRTDLYGLFVRVTVPRS